MRGGAARVEAERPEAITPGGGRQRNGHDGGGVGDNTSELLPGNRTEQNRTIKAATVKGSIKSDKTLSLMCSSAQKKRKKKAAAKSRGIHRTFSFFFSLCLFSSFWQGHW